MRLVVGIDVGGTKALAGLIDAGLTVRETVRAPTAGLDAEALVELLAGQVLALQEQAGEAIAAVGLGIPALLDHEGRAWQAPNLPLMRGAAPGPMLAERLGIPVASDNDANCAVLAEHRAGAGRGHDDIVLLTVGTGVGGGVMIGGRELRGAHGMGAELGHLVVQGEGGRPCIGDCPNLGCLESVASGSALMREAGRLADEHPQSALAAEHREGSLDGPRLTELAQGGDALACEALATIGRWLGVGMSSLANIFDPDVILIGGGVVAAGELLIGPARAEFQARAMPPIVQRCDVRAAQFGNEAGLLGAGILAQELAAGRATA